MSGQGSPERSTDLGLDRFSAPSDDLGLSLEELSEAYASLLANGSDPYESAPPADGELGDDFPIDDLADGQSPGGGAGRESPESPGDNSADGVGRAAGLVTANAASMSAAAAAGTSGAYGGFIATTERLPEGGEAEISPRTILEAMLFVGHPQHEPLTASHVASLMRGVRPAEIDELVLELNETYAAEQCAYWIESVGAGYRLVLRPEFAPLRDRFYGRVKEAKLSQQAIDVLALVAYNQPLTQPEIDRLRNASSGGVLTQLVRRGLLRVERPDQKPREPIFHTTDKFLELFGLESLDDLPQSQDPER
jgi:segregation and condensation protein B